ncbi:hypothetical protein Chor_000150 [Crotalus horridus]
MIFSKTGKKFVYVEPPRRVREVLEEELYFQRDECRIRHPSEGKLCKTSGSGKNLELEKKFSCGRLQPSFTESKLLPFSTLLLQACSHKK